MQVVVPKQPVEFDQAINYVNKIKVGACSSKGPPCPSPLPASRACPGALAATTPAGWRVLGRHPRTPRPPPPPPSISHAQNRFANDERVYKAFLEILNMYRKGQKSISMVRAAAGR
jgi:hypothetical protein